MQRIVVFIFDNPDDPLPFQTHCMCETQDAMKRNLQCDHSVML